MNAPAPFGVAERRDTPLLDQAWTVLEAANDIGDHVVVEIARRVIDARLRCEPPRSSDLYVIFTFWSDRD
jgi:hypothetical protein